MFLTLWIPPQQRDGRLVAIYGTVNQGHGDGLEHLAISWGYSHPDRSWWNPRGGVWAESPT